jgi:protease-4
MTNKQRFLWMAIGAGVVLALVISGCGLAFAVTTALAGADFNLQPAVAIVHVQGIIMSGSPPADPFTTSSGAYSGVVIDHLRQAEADGSVKAVVLRVDSPGGGVVASDEIHQQMLAMTKPVVVSMGEVAASGGYYISAPADEIFVNANTLTGSIGVISQFIDLSGLLEEYGVDATIIKSGRYKDIGSLFRSMTDEEKAIWQSIVDDAYEDFVQIVADGREMSIEEVEELATGRVFSGEQALELGLVDELGNLPGAIQRAAELGGIEGEPRIVEYQTPVSLFQGLLGLARPAGPAAEITALIERQRTHTLQYLYVAP